ncbi:MAG: hypothetical protein EBT52_08665, partial [Flavobacteriia bacterium]|nr:hypothetical protein [Flavobacteriia bacterium]
EIEQSAYEALENWDGVMETSSIGTSVFMVTNYHVMKYMLKEKLDEEFIKLYLNRIDHWDFLRNFLFQGTVPFNMQETPEDILYVGDSLTSDVHGSLGAGWQVAWYAGDPFDHPDVVSFSAWDQLTALVREGS